MRVHIEHNRLMQQVDIYVIQRPNQFLVVNNSEGIDVVEVPEGVEGPAFLKLPDEVWSAIVGVLPDDEESFVRATLAREQNRLDKFIDQVVKGL